MKPLTFSDFYLNEINSTGMKNPEVQFKIDRINLKMYVDKEQKMLPLIDKNISKSNENEEIKSLFSLTIIPKRMEMLKKGEKLLIDAQKVEDSEYDLNVYLKWRSKVDMFSKKIKHMHDDHQRKIIDIIEKHGINESILSKALRTGAKWSLLTGGLEFILTGGVGGFTLAAGSLGFLIGAYNEMITLKNKRKAIKFLIQDERDPYNREILKRQLSELDERYLEKRVKYKKARMEYKKSGGDLRYFDKEYSRKLMDEDPDIKSILK